MSPNNLSRIFLKHAAAAGACLTERGGAFSIAGIDMSGDAELEEMLAPTNIEKLESVLDHEIGKTNMLEKAISRAAARRAKLAPRTP